MHRKNPAKQDVQIQFGQNANRYVSSEEHAQGIDLDLAIEWLAPGCEEAVLDIATGGGHTAKSLAPFVRTVTVTDLTKEMLEAARVHLSESGVQNAQYVLADAEELPFLNESFDVVTCRIAAHHFPNPGAFLHEAARVLRSQGRLLLIDNTSPENRDLGNFINLAETIRDPSHVKCLSVGQWKHLLEEQGFHVKQEFLRKKTHPFVSWVNRMAPTDAHRFAVSRMLLDAPQDVREYFSVVVENQSVVSFTTDQWVALAVRK